MLFVNTPRLAPEGYIWVCTACGKTAKDKYSTAKDSTPVGWDGACVLNSLLVAEQHIGRSRANGCVTRVDKVAYDPVNDDFLNMSFEDITRYLELNGYVEDGIENIIEEIKGITLARAIDEAKSTNALEE